MGARKTADQPTAMIFLWFLFFVFTRRKHLRCAFVIFQANGSTG